MVQTKVMAMYKVVEAGVVMKVEMTEQRVMIGVSGLAVVEKVKVIARVKVAKVAAMVGRVMEVPAVEMDMTGVNGLVVLEKVVARVKEMAGVVKEVTVVYWVDLANLEKTTHSSKLKCSKKLERFLKSFKKSVLPHFFNYS